MAKPTMNLALATGALALALSTAVSAGDTASAGMLAGTCYGCHGMHGNSLGPASPSIAQMEKTAFVETMQAFKSGDTYGTIMGRIAKGYTDEEIERMAGHFAAQKFVPAKQEFDAAAAKKGVKLHDKYCEKCHEEGGKPIAGEDAEYSLLAGQWVPYLANTMTDFREGRREMPKKMKKKLDKLLKKEGEAGLAAINAFYAGQQ
ncbi:c-type cytochrome [Candidatus Thiosymbion oneisti]|uniref:c-type cytochrome n=1 Tax=Candidatus Thiosymbion oneisti TaxID=589554 RepID=UPI000B1A0C4C|nr:c-type cytochrome [Candidatus Thiosymbion oneisti]